MNSAHIEHSDIHERIQPICPLASLTLRTLYNMSFLDSRYELNLHAFAPTEHSSHQCGAAWLVQHCSAKMSKCRLKLQHLSRSIEARQKLYNYLTQNNLVAINDLQSDLELICKWVNRSWLF